MSSALRMMSAELKLCDAVIYVLDARCPFSCLNPEFEKLTERKPVVFVLNKADLADVSVVKDFKRQIKSGTVVAINSTQSGSTNSLITAIERALREKIAAAAAKGIKKTVRAMVIGVTNCGKSTLINNLARGGKTLTGDRPGVTRTKQWVPVNDHLWVLDTPGTLWPKFTNPQVAKNLAYVGSIKDEVLDTVALAKELLADLNTLDPTCLEKRFGEKFPSCMEGCPEGAGWFETICKKRGYILKGGALDELRAAKAILTEFRAGKLGRFNLDKLIDTSR